ILYKEHPDVSSGNRRGREERVQAAVLADFVLTGGALLPCIEGCDEVHVLTSFAGFEALLPGKQVVCWGMPFFAGWGLTRDHMELPRRGRSLSLDELVAATLLMYPRYFNPASGHPCEPEGVLHMLVRTNRKDSYLWRTKSWRQISRAARWLKLEL